MSVLDDIVAGVREGRYADWVVEREAAFLAQGGPAVDPLGLDPDGDGFVCGWDPARYRSAAN